MSRWYWTDGEIAFPAPAGQYLQDDEARRIGFDTFPDGSNSVEVSTVFLGLDHGFDPSQPPILWETMIFWTSGHDLDDAQWRYSSAADARAGHAAAVEFVKAALAEGAPS